MTWALAAFVSTRIVGATPPNVVLIEGDPSADHSDVVVRSTGGAPTDVRLGTVQHAPGSARHGVLARTNAGWVALVVAAETLRPGAASYTSALFRVAGGRSVRLLGDLANASSPLVTVAGTVLVQRGRDGADLAPDPSRRALRERVDELSIDAVDPETGRARRVWSGRGQLAFLAAPLSGNEAALYLVTDAGAALVALDATTGATRTLRAAMAPLARDFSYDAARGELIFVQPSRPGALEHEVVALATGAGRATGPARVLYRGESDRLMPRALGDGRLALSLPGARGLGTMECRERGAIRGEAHGRGTDAVLGETDRARWLVVRHVEADRERLELIERGSRRATSLERRGLATEFVDFAPAGRPAP